MPNHALKELEMRYTISSSVKAPMQVDSPLCTQGGEVRIYSIVCIIIYHAKNMIIKFIQAKRDVTQMA